MSRPRGARSPCARGARSLSRASRDGGGSALLLYTMADSSSTQCARHPRPLPSACRPLHLYIRAVAATHSNFFFRLVRVCDRSLLDRRLRSLAYLKEVFVGNRHFLSIASINSLGSAKEEGIDETTGASISDPLHACDHFR